ncbi:MAG TPA: DUF3891 family protein [Chloroflexota bacterium]|nr:DUF3891 family protein [Chloroflexota bacterium]
MIVRTLPDGTTALIGQTDHSRLVGQLAAHWGNATFAAPVPFDSVVRAATYHDFGWLDYETRPLVNPETGRPYEFRELPFRPAQLAAYRRWMDWLGEIDPYSAWLVNHHRTGLWQARYGTIAHPGMRYNPQNVAPPIQAFIAEQEAVQARLRECLAPGGLQVNYHLLQVWDLLGLYFCCSAPYDEYIEPVPTQYEPGEGAAVRLELQPQSDWEVALTPYPFDVRPLRVQIAYKALPEPTYPSQEAFTRAYFQAESRLLTYTLT